MIRVIYGYEYYREYPEAVTLAHPIMTAANDYAGEVYVISQVTSEGLKIMRVTNGWDDTEEGAFAEE